MDYQLFPFIASSVDQISFAFTLTLRSQVNTSQDSMARESQTYDLLGLCMSWCSFWVSSSIIYVRKG